MRSFTTIRSLLALTKGQQGLLSAFKAPSLSSIPAPLQRPFSSFTPFSEILERHEYGDVTFESSKRWWSFADTLKMQQGIALQKRKELVKSNQSKLSAEDKQDHFKSIFRAIRFGKQEDLHKLLLQNLVDIDEKFEGKSMVFQAVLNKQHGIANYLLNMMKADANSATEFQPLEVAHQNKDEMMVALLLRHGALLPGERENQPVVQVVNTR